jgi:transposase
MVKDAKRPSREHESLMAERTRLINRMKATLVRLGIPGFNVKLRKAAASLSALRTPEGAPIPPHTLSELHHCLERYAMISAQIKAIEKAREQRLKAAPAQGTHPMILMLAKVMGLGLETADIEQRN